VARADEVVCDLGMEDLLSRRFAVDEVSVKKPLLRIERRADGTINIGDLGSKEPEAEKPAGKPSDWVKAIEEWAEKLRKRVEERRRKEAERKEGKEPEVARGEGKEKPRGLRADYSWRVDYPFERIPRVLVRKLSAEALEIEFEDHAGGLKPPPIKNGKVEVTNLSDRPEHVKDPIGLSISGEIEGAPIRITGTLDFRRIAETGIEKNDLILRVEAKNVPLKQVVQAFAGGSLDADFEEGTADLNAEVSLIDLEKLGIRPPAADTALFALHGVKMQARPGSKIAGFDGQKFAQAVNEVGDLEIKDLEIGGTLSKPEFRWGETVKELVVSGGKAFARKRGQQAVDQGVQKGQEAIGRALEKNPELKKALPGGVDKDVKDKAGGILDGLFGGKKKTEEKPAPKSP
ncbi:MAG: DUF748 domain-containing protein, partial [Thermoanaerobaculia bacterium]